MKRKKIRKPDAAEQFVEAAIADFGVASALARAQRMMRDPQYRHKPRWLTKAIVLLQEKAALRLVDRKVEEGNQ